MMNGEVSRQVAALEQMGVGQLRERYVEVFGEAPRSGNRQWLLRRVAWRIQALAAGDLASRAIEQARKRAGEFARDADLCLRPPKGSVVSVLAQGGVVTPASTPQRRTLPRSAASLSLASEDRRRIITPRQAQTSPVPNHLNDNGPAGGGGPSSFRESGELRLVRADRSRLYLLRQARRVEPMVSAIQGDAS